MAKTIVIGGGAAGMMAAYAAAMCGNEVSLYEKNEKLGKKVYITGKGRCNVTNACETQDLFINIVTNPKFMYSPIYTFDNNMVQSFMEEWGCPLKTERGNRVFPQSDKSYDVINALIRAMRENNVDINLDSHVSDILTENGHVTGVRVNGCNIECDNVILATGGYSYPSTGSTGEGHTMASKLGHHITKCMPALVPFTAAEEWVKELQGLSLRNCGVTIYDGDHKIYEDFGELLFTHFGVSGPTVLSASSYAVDIIRKRPLRLVIDLKPALDEKQLDARILRDFEANINRKFMNSLDKLFPKSLIPVIIERSGIDAQCRVNEITRDKRQGLVKLIKNFDLTLTGLRGFNEAIITHGGVDVKEIDSSTMESKLIKGLYFAGEMIDVDAVTGGFNLQVAWSTGYLAGISQNI
ncbi:pyridine nucleotide-disulfide oxidoreductase [Butyrivibrio sp. CAG:318]|jgi:predicted Rossmann fold flavoprotein|nr:pyridine nucleotide-disulfide oxidoreductase [Butyrivibrio sp. CAG:318]